MIFLINSNSSLVLSAILFDSVEELYHTYGEFCQNGKHTGQGHRIKDITISHQIADFYHDILHTDNHIRLRTHLTYPVGHEQMQPFPFCR